MPLPYPPTPALPFPPQMEQVKQDLSRKDTELLGLQTKLETLTNQFSDSKQHIEVLKESLTAKEQRAAILQTEVQPMHIFRLYRPCSSYFGQIVPQSKVQNLSYVKEFFLSFLLLPT